MEPVPDTIPVNGRVYRVRRLLGHGKGGYSYLAAPLAADDGSDTPLCVVKQIHHEPCAYYTFGDKFASELRDYDLLCRAGIRIPDLLETDPSGERLRKAYIPGPTVYDLVMNHRMEAAYVQQGADIALRAKAAGLNLDYFPTNFILHEGLLWYVDYECNPYMEEWSFPVWGVRYWFRSPELLDWTREHGKEYRFAAS